MAEVQKHLTYYELDLGLNHVVRKGANRSITGRIISFRCPVGATVRVGARVCCENFIIYKHQNHDEVRAVIPRRTSLAGDRGVLIVSSAGHRSKNSFFFLAQSRVRRRLQALRDSLGNCERSESEILRHYSAVRQHVRFEDWIFVRGERVR